MGSDSDEDGGEYEDTDRNKGHKKQHRRRRRPHSAWRLFKLALTSALGACVLLLLVRMWHVDITSDAARADQYMYRPAPHVRDVCHAVQENVEMTMALQAAGNGAAAWAAEELLRRWMHFMLVRGIRRADFEWCGEASGSDRAKLRSAGGGLCIDGKRADSAKRVEPSSALSRIADFMTDKALLGVFGTRDSGLTGGVGKNATAIREVLSPAGSFREKMSLLYVGLTKRKFSKQLLEMLRDLKAAGAVAKAASDWEAHTHLVPQLLLERDTQSSVDPDHGGRADNFFKILPGPVAEQNLTRYAAAKEQWQTTQTANDVLGAPLSERELRVALRGGLDSTERLSWIPGGRYWKLVNSSRFMRHANERGLRTVAGPSSTTLRYMQLALYLNMSSPLELMAVRLACVGWMVPAFDHSYHEVMLGAVSFGLQYTNHAFSYQKLLPWSRFTLMGSDGAKTEIDGCDFQRRVDTALRNLKQKLPPALACSRGLSLPTDAHAVQECKAAS